MSPYAKLLHNKPLEVVHIMGGSSAARHSHSLITSLDILLQEGEAPRHGCQTKAPADTFSCASPFSLLM